MVPNVSFFTLYFQKTPNDICFHVYYWVSHKSVFSRFKAYNKIVWTLVHVSCYSKANKNALTNINLSFFVLYFFIKVSLCRCIVLLSWQILQMRKERTEKISFFSTCLANIQCNKRSTKLCSCLLWYFLNFF